MAYDPRLGAFAETAVSKWGNVEKNREKLIRYWMCDAFDNAIYGLRMNSELIAIKADKKKRKTTLLANWLLNFARQLPGDEWICIDTLESGMPPQRYAETLIAILATKIMISLVLKENNRKEWPSVEQIIRHPDLLITNGNGEVISSQLRINPDFFYLENRTPFQEQAIQAALKLSGTLPISIFGPAKDEGQTRYMEKSHERWDMLHEGTFPGLEGMKHRIFCVDNIQQLSEFAGNSYYGLETIVNGISLWLVTHPGSEGFAVCQESMGSGEVRGGTRMSEECNYVFDTEYDRDGSPLTMKIINSYSRMTPTPTIIQEIEPVSGAFLRLATTAYGE